MAVIKHKEQRVGVFIDAQNLYHTAKNLYGKKVNFGAVLEVAVGDRALIRALAYVITSEAGDEESFFEALTKLGIETKTKDLQIFSSGSKKGDWDVGLAIDAVAMAPKLDTVIIVSGDGDFIPLVEFLKINKGCQVEVVSFGRSSSHRLKEVADDFIDLDQDVKRYCIGQRRHRNSQKTQRQEDGHNNSDRDQKTEKKPQGKNQPQKSPEKKVKTQSQNKPQKSPEKKTPQKTEKNLGQSPQKKNQPRKRTTKKPRTPQKKSE